MTKKEEKIEINKHSFITRQLIKIFNFDYYENIFKISFYAFLIFAIYLMKELTFKPNKIFLLS